MRPISRKRFDLKCNDNTPAILVNNVSKKFRIYHERNQTIKERFVNHGRSRYEEFWALNDVSLSLPHGVTLGLIGENGSGKSTLLKIIAKILHADSGTFQTEGKVSTLLELGAGFHPELSGRENIYLNGSILGLGKKEIDEKYAQIVAFSELEKFIDMPVKNYSSGMYVRLGFAVAINVDPDILLIDEVLAVGDEAFQRKCSDKIYDFKNSGKTIVVVSHSLEAVRNLCDRVIWLDHGTVRGEGDARTVVDQYLDEVNKREQEKAQAPGQPEPEFQGTRAGTHEIEITGVRFYDKDGKETTFFKTGDTLRCRIEYNAKMRIEGPVFGVAIFRNDGIHITGPNTKVNGFEIKSVEGLGVIEYQVERLPLLAGTYLFSSAVYDSACLKPFDHHDKMYSFKVMPGGTTETNGLAVLQNSWSLKGSE